MTLKITYMLITKIFYENYVNKIYWRFVLNKNRINLRH